MNISENDLHSLRAELLASKTVVGEHEKMRDEFKVIVDCLTDALVATASLLNFNLDPRGLEFASDAIDAIRRALNATQAASAAQDRMIDAMDARLDQIRANLPGL